MKSVLRVAFFVTSVLASACTSSRPFGDAQVPDGDATHDVTGDVDAGPAYTIDPSDAVIALRDTLPVTTAYRVVHHRADGSTEIVSGTVFTLDDPSLGSFDGATLTTTGAIGRTTIHATFMHDGASDTLATTVTVRRVIEVVSDVPSDVRAAFDGPTMMDPSHASRVDYPLDGAMMPIDVPPFDVQWDRGVLGDVYRVALVRPFAEIDAYVRNTGDAFTFDWNIDASAWQTLLRLQPDAPIAIRVDRLDAATQTVFAGAPVTITIAQAPLFGQIYYWQSPNLDGTGPSRENFVRVGVATARHDVIAPNPPYIEPTPPADNSAARCVGCHAISRDGRWASTVSGEGVNLMFDLTADLSGDPAPTRYPAIDPRLQQPGPYYTSTFNPDGTRLMIAMYGVIGRGTGFALLDPRNGASVDATGIPGVPATTPRWSPDGTSVAFIANGDDSEDGSATGDLELLPQTAPDTFGSPRVLHQGGDLATAPERGTADSHPDFSPDNAWIVFQHGTQSAARTRPPSALYLIAANGGSPIRLHAASGGVDGHDAYWPAFSPFVTHEADGASHYWIAFVSLRDYGNAMAGTMGLRRPQVWISAVDTNPTHATDPSHVPFWLSGQLSTATNLAPAWSGPPCREAGEVTDSGSRCCSGNAGTDAAHPGVTVCISPAACRALGATCSATSDCCASLGCDHHVCTPAIGTPR